MKVCTQNGFDKGMAGDAPHYAEGNKGTHTASFQSCLLCYRTVG